MKTKISHLGRSTVSVILAVMMLLSTMLIGTVSTVNAATKTFNTVNLVGNINGNIKWDSTEYPFTFDETTGNWYLDITITQSSEFKARVNNDWGISFGASGGNYTISEIGDYRISVKDGAENGTDLKVEKTVKKVADSVTLTANPTSITEGASSTLTATLNTKNSSVGDVTYTFTDANNNNVGTKTTSDSTASIVVTPSATTTYKVTVSADNYTSVSATATVTVKTTPKAELLYGTSGDPLNSTTSLSMTYDAESDCFYYVVDSNLYNSDFRFRFSYDSIQYGAAWETYPKSKTVNVDGDKVDVNNNVNNWGNKPGCEVGNATSKFTIWFDANNLKTWIVNAEAPKYTVIYAVNDEAMGSVKATYADSTSIGTSPASVEEGKSVTFTATAENGYKFDGWYSDANCTTAIENATGATYTTTVTADTTVYAKFSAVSYNITTEAVTNYSVVVKESAEYNSTVAVTVTVTDNAYEVNGITVTDKDNKVVNVNGGESGVYTFTMPASDVTVKANSKLKQIGAPTVAFNVLGQSTAAANVLGSTVITASYTAAENSTIVVGSENVAVTNADGATISADKYSLVKNTATGSYTFTANEPGTYKLSYTVTAKSNYDESMTATNSPVSVTITVSYTATQNAYLALEEYVNSVKNTTSDGYTTDSYAAFSVALTSAQDLLTGLPNSDATNASDYTNAKTALETAFNGLEKDVTYYIGGRFKGESWNPNRTDMQFVKVDGESNLYKYETNMTVSQLSQNVDNAKQYFFIHTGNGNEKVYYASSDGLGHTFHKNSINNQLTLKYYPTKADDEKNYIKFDDVADSSSNVVLYLDTSDKDNLKLYYSADIDPDYRITGTLANAGGWSHKFASSMKFDTLETDGSYSKEVSISDADITSSSNYFRLINNESYYDGSLNKTVNKEYGPYTETDKENTSVNICDFNSKDKAYGTYQNNATAFYFSKAGTYKIHYFIDTTNSRPSVWVEENTTKYNVTVAENIKSIASVDKTEAAKGEKVTVTATPESGKILQSVTVVGEDGSTSITTTVSGNTATFTMPDQNVTVTGVTFRTANTYTVTFSSNNSEYGTVSAMKGATSITSPATVTEGDTVTFTATPKSGYALSNWTVTANGTSETRTDSSLSLTITADTTVTANFKVEDSGTIVNNMYFLYGSTNNPLNWEGQQGYNQSGYGKYNVYEKDGKYIVTLNKEHYKQLYFAFSTSNYYKNMTPKDKLAGVNPDNPVDLRLVTTGKESFNADNTQYVFGMMSIVSENSEYIGDIKIIYDPTANTYTVKATKDSASDTTVNITGKDGTIRAGFTNTGDKKTTAVLGDTTLSITTPDDKIITASDSYKIDGKNRAVTAKKVPYGSTVTVTTTIDPDATFAGHNGSDYYVKGFSVNGIFGGVLSQTEGKNHSSDVYTYTFEVNQEIYGSKLEITPVYFLKDDANCVYFYIENYDSAKQIWGNTPSCYVYYGSGDVALEALGYYPGQPMVDYNGSIFTQIPKSIVNGDTREKITGMTLNNYVWDDVHRDYNGKDQKSDNAQTYDYDDFVKIAESGAAADNIIYRFKYNTHDNVPKDTLGTSDTDAAGWEVFLDYQNYPTDIFGNRIGTAKLDYKDTKSVTSKDNYLSIISNGYQNNYIGKYATAWSIYNKAGNRVATIPSSALLYALGKTDEQMTTAIGSKSTPTDFLPGKKDRDTYWKTFKTLYNDYKGFYAQINFEAAITGGDEKGNRLDGRWYYTKSQQEITGEIKIQYANTLDDYKVGDFNEDKFADEDASSIVGTTTGASAYFTNPKDQVRKLETFADNTQDYKFEVNATSTAAYTFVGWYRLIDGDYKAINPSNMSSLTGAVTQNSDVTLVARYIKTPGGSMTFQHSLYKGENAGGGKATTEIQVVVKDSDDKPLYDSGRIAGTASIDKTKIAELATQTGLTVTVTLYTTTKNLYNFNGYYSAENTTDITAFNPTTGFTTKVSGNRKEGLVTTSEYTFSFDDYYKTHQNTLIGPDAGTVYYNFYSDITSIKVPYKVQFSYTDRTGAQKYYNKAGYVDPENTSSYTFVEDTTNVEGVESHPVKVTLTNSFILSLAPYESNFTKNLTWDNPTDSKPFDSSVSKSIASAVVNSTQSDKKIHLNVFRDGKGAPTPRTNTAGAFKLFTKNDSPELPYGSVFYTSNGDGTYTYDITAPKTYTDESGNVLKFMYWEIYSDQECENLVIKAYNSEGHFSYVAYDNCWIVPVYGESSTPVASVKEVSTSTQFMEVTRNQWTADTNSNFAGFNADSMTTLNTAKDFIKEKGEDKLYADFVLNFFYNGKQLSVFDPNSENVKAGILIQRLDLDENETSTGYITDLDYYANKYKPELDAAKNDAINKIKNNQSKIKSVKQQIDNHRLDNKNRLQYYTLFNNVKGNNNCVFRLYTYIQYTDASGETAVELSNPVYFTFYDIANKS